ncbi:MAG: hypothetical protein PWP39_654 [Pyrococcus sp.]|uniref:hypothetical protein n=1 Tax=Pyrococcus sp. TaxID=33866 RepID=UPI002586AF50|nr:hypothetical protein [Pyrococcus sp.]MDK2869419.1 hypothetical protein [Pyrococcus sp.]
MTPMETSNEQIYNIYLPKVAEESPIDSLEKIEPVGKIRNYIDISFEGIKRVENGVSAFYPMAIFGYYGSGKTFFVRKLSEKIVKELERTIPLHFYLGQTSYFDLIKFVDELIESIEVFIERGDKTKATISGYNPEKWMKYLEVLKAAREKISNEEAEKSNVEAFIKFLNEINHAGYYPFVFFDEFETVWIGGVLQDDRSYRVFVDFSSRLFEMIRGKAYSGGICFVLTKPVRELIREAASMNPRLVRELNEAFGTSLVDYPEMYPLEREPARETLNIFNINWSYEDLELLSKKYNLVIHEDILMAISRVLPTPRAVINIYYKLLAINRSNITSPTIFGKLAEDKLDIFINKVISEFVAPNSKWHLIFKTLVENGILYVYSRDWETIKKIAALLEVSASDEKKLVQKVKNYLNKLRDLGLYEYNKPYSTYLISPDVLAFLLGIEKLPDGRKANEDTLKLKVKAKIEERKKKKQMYRESKVIS